MPASPKATVLSEDLPAQRSRIRERLIDDGIYRTDGKTANDLWRIGSEPYGICPEEMAVLTELGGHLLSFYRALNRLYFESLKGRAPSWVSAYLDQGKPESVLRYGRMNRFKQDIPGVIRPDLLLTDAGRFVATELDAVPGGIGLTGSLTGAYSEQGYDIVGGASGMVEGFARMIRRLAGRTDPHLAVVVSEESRDYRPEMRWLAGQLNGSFFPTVLCAPQEVGFTEEGLFVRKGDRNLPVDVLYRFFELFDLPNIPKAELILYAAKKKKVVLTPPPKPQLEEKLAFALFHHPGLYGYWRQSLGEASDSFLRRIFPETWVLDPRDVPPHAAVLGLVLDGKPVRDYHELASATQRQRELVIKPSGFSELAWGSRGVSVGHDLSEKDWAEAVHRALEAYPGGPYILQPFYRGRPDRIGYIDFERMKVQEMTGRVRLSPYYFVDGDQAILGGVLATLCGMEKKLLHGMVDAVMVPCAVKESGRPTG